MPAPAAASGCLCPRAHPPCIHEEGRRGGLPQYCSARFLLWDMKVAPALGLIKGVMGAAGRVASALEAKAWIGQDEPRVRSALVA